MKKKIFSFEYFFQSSLWWIPSRASHHGTEVQNTLPMNTLISEAVTKVTWSNSLFPILVSMNKLVILWKISSTFAPSTADKPYMCFGSSFSRISALRNCGVCDAMRAHLYLGNEPAHLAPIQVQSQVFNIIKQTPETVGHTEKYLLNYRILSEGMCSCCLLVGFSRNCRYIGSEIPGSFSAAECTLSVYLKPQITCSLALSLHSVSLLYQD